MLPVIETGRTEEVMKNRVIIKKMEFGTGLGFRNRLMKSQLSGWEALLILNLYFHINKGLLRLLKGTKVMVKEDDNLCIFLSTGISMLHLINSISKTKEKEGRKEGGGGGQREGGKSRGSRPSGSFGVIGAEQMV